MITDVCFWLVSETQSSHIINYLIKCPTSPSSPASSKTHVGESVWVSATVQVSKFNMNSLADRFSRTLKTRSDHTMRLKSTQVTTLKVTSVYLHLCFSFIFASAIHTSLPTFLCLERINPCDPNHIHILLNLLLSLPRSLISSLLLLSLETVYSYLSLITCGSISQRYRWCFRYQHFTIALCRVRAHEACTLPMKRWNYISTAHWPQSTRTRSRQWSFMHQIITIWLMAMYSGCIWIALFTSLHLSTLGVRARVSWSLSQRETESGHCFKEERESQVEMINNESTENNEPSLTLSQ